MEPRTGSDRALAAPAGRVAARQHARWRAANGSHAQWRGPPAHDLSPWHAARV